MIKALEHASKLEHIMDFTRLRCMGSLFSMLHQACRNVALYNNNHPDFPMPIDQLEKYMQVMYFSVPEYKAHIFQPYKGYSLVNASIINHHLFFITEISDLCCAVVLLW